MHMLHLGKVNVKCLGSEKLHFAVAEGAPLFHWKPGGSLLSSTVAGIKSVIVIARVYETLLFSVLVGVLGKRDLGQTSLKKTVLS